MDAPPGPAAPPPEAEREVAVLLAKVAEQAERYPEMLAFMQQALRLNPIFSVEERNLFSVAYKNLVGSRRASWRIIASLEQRVECSGNETSLRRVRSMRVTVEQELRAVCDSALSDLNTLISAPCEPEARLFYYKMRGDYYRYFGEFLSGDEARNASRLSSEAYDTARDIASASLPATHPIRLGLALSFATFYYEILGQPARAIELAKIAFDDAIANLDQVDEANYRDVTLQLQMLRDNLTLWTAEKENVDRFSKLP